KCVEKYLAEKDKYITITFCEKSGEKLVTKGTYAKMARGEMVRYMAEHQIEDLEEIKKFHRLGYVYREDLSGETEYVFERNL
ncbi:MAG: peroxide stress protein YaaA, partial [Eubacterium sp.]|nr:peroxide stress protein YaaA [Eubacterium sp.]